MPEHLTEPLALHEVDWTDSELSSAVQAYLEMLYFELEGRPYSKAQINRGLREGALSNRTKGSIEFRMRNISAALNELRMPWISGYLPAKNIGPSIKEKLINILRLHGVDALDAFVPTSNSALLAEKVSSLRKRRVVKIPRGIPTPSSITSTTSMFVRDPGVRAWVLQNANGTCEGCNSHAPFIGQDGFPYLEVHHVMPLASHGSDTVTNAVALCPNCHRRCHSSSDRHEFKLQLYRKIPRLILEVPEPSTLGTDEFIA